MTPSRHRSLPSRLPRLSLAAGLSALVCLLSLLCLSPARAAGFMSLSVPAAGEQPALEGAIWYPCQAPTIRLMIRLAALDVTPDCPLEGPPAPLIVISHGSGGNHLSHADTAIALAEAGNIVVSFNHPGDTTGDTGRRIFLSSLTNRPRAVSRVIDHVLEVWPQRAHIDPGRIGFFGFSRGGFTGLVLAGAVPDFAAARTTVCDEALFSLPCLVLSVSDSPPTEGLGDPRIRAAVIADPLSQAFPADSLRGLGPPIQLWRSEHGGDGVSPAGIDELARHLPAGSHYEIVPDSGHFAFLAPCSPELARVVPEEICTDATGFDRVAFHHRLNTQMADFFRATLGTTPGEIPKR